jgi:hypothetical protein
MIECLSGLKRINLKQGKPDPILLFITGTTDCTDYTEDKLAKTLNL